MDAHILGPVNQGIEASNSLAGMSSCAIWAGLSLLEFLLICWALRKHFKSNDDWRKIREQQIASEAAQTEVLKRQTEEIVSLKMIITKFLVKE